MRTEKLYASMHVAFVVIVLVANVYHRVRDIAPDAATRTRSMSGDGSCGRRGLLRNVPGIP